MKESNIFNKKGFTLLELLIAVSIFGVILVMTFSIINYVPKLAKSESSQFSERTYVRRAVTDITEVIQSASKVNESNMEFELPGGDKIVYILEGGNVNKYVNGISQRFMESVAEFQITRPENKLFNIHIRTATEGKAYDFKVEKRMDIRTKTDAKISTISPTTGVFDKNGGGDITINIALNGNYLIGLKNDGIELDEDIDYVVSGNTVLIKAGYFTGLGVGTENITFDVTNGEDPVLTVEIKDTTSHIKIEGDAFTDDIARMYYPGNLQIDPYDDKWVINVTNATLKDKINSSDMEIRGLPEGITASAAKVKDVNNISLTLSGTASAPVTTIRDVEVVIRSSAVTNTDVSESNPIKVFMLPGAVHASPERNLMFTTEIYTNARTTVTGDIVIGRGQDTYINNRTDINGYVYVDGNLYTNNRFIVGTEDKPAKVFVDGSVTFNSNTTIYGDLYYKNTLTKGSNVTVTGVCERRAVEIPTLNVPKLKRKQWYIDNGYTVVDSYWPKVELKDNGKYYYEIDYYFDDPISGLENVIIVGKGNIGFNSKFSGSGILFAPNGTIYTNNFTFTGMCISRGTTLNDSSILLFKRYAELPFDENYQ